MPFNIPVTSDANIELSLFNIPVTSDANIEFDPVGGAPSFSVVVQDATQAVTADNVTITAHNPTLVIANATQAVTADNVTITAHNGTLEIQDATQAVTADNLKITFHSGVVVDTVGAKALYEQAYFNEYRRRQLEEDDEEVMAVMYA
jgi:hypothetical protein